MKQLKAKIISNTKVAEDFYRMRLSSAYLAGAAKPGQFVEVRCTDGIDPLLRRPLGCHRILDDGIEVLYELVGKGTGLLSQKKAGETLDLIGPLGNGFEPNTAGPAVLVAGGIGVAPLISLAEELVKQQKRTTHVVIGARSSGHILCEKEFRSMGCAVKIATEDGSKGRKGLATELLKDILTTYDLKLTTIYACGPTSMLKAVAGIAGSNRIPCQVSLEERMACGVGVCLGCPVKIKTSGEYKMVCKDGPVFNAEDVAW